MNGGEKKLCQTVDERVNEWEIDFWADILNRETDKATNLSKND